LTPWLLWWTSVAERAALMGTEAELLAPPEGGLREESADGHWLTVYGPRPDDVDRDAARPIVEVYQRRGRVPSAPGAIFRADPERRSVS
jgi:hypothetical protein